MKRIAVLTSGGDAPGMNAAIRSVVRTALHHGLSVFGVSRGYLGLMNGEIQEMDTRSVGDIVQRAGTILRSARSERFKTEEGQREALFQLEKFGIEGLVVIGGDGSFRGAKCLSDLGVPTIGIPASIDNDVACTDLAIGFDTATNTAVDAITKIRDTASSHGRVNVIEVMGRTTGFLALAAGLAGGAEHILIPEVEFDLDDICDKILSGYRRGKTHNIIVVAEGVGGYRDPGQGFGHSAGFEVGRTLQEKTGLETRVTVLGYIQRGGTPTAQDRILASRFGLRAVELLMAGRAARVVGITRGEIMDYDISYAVSQKKTINLDDYRLSEMLT
ncbi:MAG TPA: 6-phosphofructokinase [Firmicutes bacterium]|nr:6-phosphofructokinase [Bacillota bacterium]